MDDNNDKPVLNRRRLLKSGAALTFGFSGMGAASAQSTAGESTASNTNTSSQGTVVRQYNTGHGAVTVTKVEDPEVPDDLNLGPPKEYQTEALSASSNSRTNTVKYRVKGKDHYVYDVYVSWGYTNVEVLWVNAAGDNVRTGSDWTYKGQKKEWYSYKTNSNGTRIAAIAFEQGKYDGGYWTYGTPYCKVYVNHHGNSHLVDSSGGYHAY